MPVALVACQLFSHSSWSGINLLKPCILWNMMVCFNPSLLFLLQLILISEWLHQLEHIWGLVLWFWKGGGFKTGGLICIYRARRKKKYSVVCHFPMFWATSACVIFMFVDVLPFIRTSSITLLDALMRPPFLHLYIHTFIHHWFCCVKEGSDRSIT